MLFFFGLVACSSGTCPPHSARNAEGLCVLLDASPADSGGGGGGQDSAIDTETGDSGEGEGCPPETRTDVYAQYPVYIEGTDRRFVSIQDGIWGAAPGDEVVVCPGIYGENIDFKGKAITLRSAVGPLATVIQGDGTASVVSIRLYEGQETVLEGFTITGGHAKLSSTDGHGGGIYVEWGQPILRHNIIVGNQARIAGGVYVRNAGAYLYNNIIAWNTATEAGGGMVCTACWGEVRYNTFYQNEAPEGSAAEWYWGIADLVGNALVLADAGERSAIRYLDPRGVPFEVDHNLRWPKLPLLSGSGQDQWPVGTWIVADPLLNDPAHGDWRVSPHSPLRDAGPPEEQDATDGSRADIGAFGGPQGDWTP